MKSQPYGSVNKQRIVPLKELLPLVMPFSILIEPTNQCNFRCKFCPTGDPDLLKQINRPEGHMKYDLYIKIINDLRSMCEANDSRLPRLHLYKDGDPLLNKKIGKMIAYAKDAGVSESIETTTNGAALTNRRALELIECGLDAIRISVEHVTDDGYREITRTDYRYSKIKDHVKFLFKEKERRNSSLKVHVKIVDTGLSEKEKDKFVEDFAPISDSLDITRLMDFTEWTKSEVLDMTSEHDANAGITVNKDWNVCPEPFAKLAVNFNGTVSVCCADWCYGTIVGDLNSQSLSEVWHGEKLREFRLLHLSGRRKEIDICSNCDYLKGLSEHTKLDAAADQLLKVYSSA